MMVLGRDLVVKLGNDGLSALGIEIAASGFHGGEQPCVLIWHGQPDEVEQVLQANPATWVLCVSSGAIANRDIAGLESRFPGRIRGLTWGLRSGDRKFVWRELNRTQRWKVYRLQQFIAAASSQTDGPPPWQLLRPPRVPEHVLASYLCALAGEIPDGSWEAGFTAEVNYWRVEERVSVSLAWSDRHHTTRLRSFLASSQVILSGSRIGDADVVALPGAPPVVTRLGYHLEHALLKRGLQELDDQSLRNWTRSGVAMREVIPCGRSFVNELPGLCGASLLEVLSPLAATPGEVRQRMAKRLLDAFARGFPLDGVADRLSRKVDALEQALAEFPSTSDAPGPDLEAPTARIKAAAGSLREEVLSLPQGFWLPRALRDHIDGGQE